MSTFSFLYPCLQFGILTNALCYFSKSATRCYLSSPAADDQILVQISKTFKIILHLGLWIFDVKFCPILFSFAAWHMEMKLIHCSTLGLHLGRLIKFPPVSRLMNTFCRQCVLAIREYNAAHAVVLFWISWFHFAKEVPTVCRLSAIAIYLLCRGYVSRILKSGLWKGGTKLSST